MCFTPAISIVTFAVEIILGLWILSKNPKRTINQVGAVILFLLGAYQLTEFMVCTSGNPLLWGKMAHLAYTFLPALGIHWVYALSNNKGRLFYIYIIPVIFTVLTLFSENFIQVAECNKYFINIIYSWSPLWALSYNLYYGLFILLAGWMFFKLISKENNKRKRKIYVWGLVGVLSFTLSTFLFLIVFPSYNLMFPSILCEFALLFGIIVTYIVKLTSKK